MRVTGRWALLGISLGALAASACGDDDSPSNDDAGASDAKSDGRRDVTSIVDARDGAAIDTRDSGTTDARDASESGSASDGGQTPLQRGEYLVKVIGACGDCHTPRTMNGQDNTKFLAGVAGRFQVPGLLPDGGVGIIGSSNLTPDLATGLGGWTDAQIKKALLDGVDKDGKALFPIMPYYVLHNMSAADADAIVVYLRSIPAVSNAVPARNFDLPGPSPAVPADKIPNPTLQTTDVDYASAMRGKYLAGNIGLCMECHTEHLQTAGAVPLNLDKLFAGGDEFFAQGLGLPSPPFPPAFLTENITPHATGIQGWTAAAVIKVMKEGVDKDGLSICPPMPNGPTGPFGGMTDVDARDIANYIVHLPPIDNSIGLVCHDIMNGDGGKGDGGKADGGVPDASNDVSVGAPDGAVDVVFDGTPKVDTGDTNSVDVGNDITPSDVPNDDTTTNDANDGATPDVPSFEGGDAPNDANDSAPNDGVLDDANDANDGATNDAADDQADTNG